MIDPKKIEKFARYLHESVPKAIHDFKSDLDSKIKKILQYQISQMDFVTREEFDIQTQILHHTQEKLKKLETQITTLESKHQHKIPSKN